MPPIGKTLSEVVCIPLQKYMTELITDGTLKALARFGCIDSYGYMGIERDIRRCIA